MPSPAEAAAFQALILTLVGRIGAQFGATVPSDYPDIVDPLLAAVATLTAQWYHELAPEAPFIVDIPELTPTDALWASARWAETQADPAQALRLSTERRVFDTSRTVIAHNAAREGVRFARYASATACPWCRVLASRGAVYHTAAGATHGHDGDHCIAVPERPGNPYRAPDYVAGWEREYNTARSRAGGNVDDIVNYMRRQETSPTPGA